VEIQTRWMHGRGVSIREMVEALADSRLMVADVQAAAWTVVADAAASGRLLLIGELSDVELDLDTPVELLAPDVPPIIPEPLPDSLEPAQPVPYRAPEANPVVRPQIPGPTVDVSQLEMLPKVCALPPERREHLLATVRRNQAATEAWQAGASYRQVAKQFGMQGSQVHYLVKRVLKHGQRAWIPHGRVPGTAPQQPAP